MPGQLLQLPGRWGAPERGAGPLGPAAPPTCRPPRPARPAAALPAPQQQAAHHQDRAAQRPAGARAHTGQGPQGAAVQPGQVGRTAGPAALRAHLPPPPTALSSPSPRAHCSPPTALSSPRPRAHCSPTHGPQCRPIGDVSGPLALSTAQHLPCSFHPPLPPPSCHPQGPHPPTQLPMSLGHDCSPPSPTIHPSCPFPRVLRPCSSISSFDTTAQPSPPSRCPAPPFTAQLNTPNTARRLPRLSPACRADKQLCPPITGSSTTHLNIVQCPRPTPLASTCPHSTRLSSRQPACPGSSTPSRPASTPSFSTVEVVTQARACVPLCRCGKDMAVALEELTWTSPGCPGPQR